jgi:hypothetical protein
MIRLLNLFRRPRRAGSKRRALRPAARRPTARPMVEQLETRIVPAGQWAQLANDAPDGIGTMLLMTDGSVMAQGPQTSKNWYKLTPGSDGGYTSGTWSNLPDMHTERLFFASNVLHDGRVFVVGGEYSGEDGDKNWTNSGEVYDPGAQAWTTITPFPQTQFGDDPSVLLNNGQLLCGYLNDNRTYRYNPVSNTWNQTAGSKLHNNDRSDEETWLKLPDGSVLSYDVNNDADNGQSTAQRYIPSMDQWVDAGTVPVNLSNSALGNEMGGATLLPDGRAWFVGATGSTAFYTPSTNTWAAGPNLPNGQHADDAPLCMMSNGHVLLAADGPGGTFSTHTHLYDFDPSLVSTNFNPFTQVDVPGLDLSDVAAYKCRMLALPSGQVLFTANYADDNLYVYTPSGLPNDAWRPTITGISQYTGFTLQPAFVLSGTQINGISAGASYGDDAEMDSNYPIVKFTDSVGQVHYAQGFDRSSNGVQTGSTLVSTTYFLPPGITDGAFLVQAVANGIASKPVLNVIMDQSLNNVTLQGNSGFYDVFQGTTLLSQWDTNTFSAVDVTMVSGGTLNILTSLVTAPVNVYGAGQATINIGNGDMNHLSAISGAIDLENPSGFNTININDSLAPVRTLHSHTVKLTSVNLTTILNGSSGASGQMPSDLGFGLIDVPITWKYADTSRVTIRGPAGGLTWNVLGTGVATQIVAGGADTFNVGNAGSVQGILGELDIEDPPDFAVINLDNSADFHARTVFVRTLGTNPLDFGGSTEPWGQVAGLAPGNINFEYADTASITVQTGFLFPNVVNVQGTGVTTNIVSHWSDAVNLGNAGSLAGILGTLNIENPPNQSDLTIDDSADTTTRTVTLSDIGPNPSDSEHDTNHWGQISGLAPASINYEYSDIYNVALSLGSAASTVNILAEENFGTTTLTAHAALAVNVGNAGNAQGLTTPLVLNGPTNSITLTVDDSADTTARVVTATTTGVTGLARGDILFTASQIASVTLDGGSAGNTFSVPSTVGNRTLTIQAGIGSNTVTAGNVTDGLQDIKGLLNLIGQGNTTLILDDRANSSTTNYVIGNGVILSFGQHFNVNYSGLKSLVFDAGSGSNDSFAVLATPAATALTINAGAGGDTVTANLGSGGGASPIQGPLSVNGQGNTGVTVFDQNTSTTQTYTLTGTTVKRTNGLSVTYSNLQSLTINGGSGGNSFVVSATPSATQVTLTGGSGVNKLTGPNATTTWTISGAGSGVLLGKVNFTAMHDLVGGSGNDTFKFTGSGSIAGTVNGGAGRDTLDYSALAGPVTINLQTLAATLIRGAAAGGFAGFESLVGSASTADKLTGPDADTNWTINRANGGTVGAVAFAGFENLQGGAGVDVFKFVAGGGGGVGGTGSLSGTLDGGGAPVNEGNWLDYSGVTTAVVVNLQTGSATGVFGGAVGMVANIQNVHGGDGGSTLTGNAEGNILIGGAGADTLIGGSGASILIGDTGVDSVTGGSGGDILIGDSTSFDAMTTSNEQALMAILAEWQSVDSYATRFTDIDTGTGGGLNGTFSLNFGTTVNDDGSAETVTAAPSAQALDWFFQGAGDTLQNVEPGEHINNNTPAAFKNRTVTSPIDEGSLATVSGTITEPDPQDSFTLKITWGDGTPTQTYTFPPGSNGRLISVTHRYRDEGSYTIQLFWTDPTGPANQATLPVTVLNVAPTVDAGSDATVQVGHLFKREGSFADPGAGTWTATVDYGDGAGAQPLALEGHDFRLRHHYQATGVYHVVVTVLDDDGAVGTASFTVTAG